MSSLDRRRRLKSKNVNYRRLRRNSASFRKRRRDLSSKRMSSEKKWSRNYRDKKMRSDLLSNVCVKNCENSKSRKSQKSHNNSRSKRMVQMSSQISSSMMHRPIISQQSFRRHR